MKEPLPCPFCGKEVAPYQIIDRHYITCYNDDCEVNPSMNIPSDTEIEAIRKWNKRGEIS